MVMEPTGEGENFVASFDSGNSDDDNLKRKHERLLKAVDNLSQPIFDKDEYKDLNDRDKKIIKTVVTAFGLKPGDDSPTLDILDRLADEDVFNDPAFYNADVLNNNLAFRNALLEVTHSVHDAYRHPSKQEHAPIDDERVLGLVGSVARLVSARQQQKRG